MTKGIVRQPAVVIILSIVTCGIYHLVWMYQVTTEMKAALEKVDMNPGLDVLLSIVTCGIYYYYWSYNVGKNIAEMQKRVGLQVADDSVLYLVLAIFGLGIINQPLMQTKLNEIWVK